MATSNGGTIKRPVQSIDLQKLRGKTNTTVNNFDIPDLIAWLNTADKGDPTRQARISLEILEKDFDLAQLHATRAEAVSSIDADILTARNVPAGREAEAIDKANFVRDALQAICPHPESGLEDMRGLYKNMQSALLPGYSISQIHWKDNIGMLVDL